MNKAGAEMICIENLTKSYNKGKSNAFDAIKDINLTIDDQDLIAIVGTSGAGKSTLLHIMATIDDADYGTVKIDGTDITKINSRKKASLRNEKIGIVIQDYALINEYSVIENVMLPLAFSKTKKKKDVARKALLDVGIEHLSKKQISKLSGGEKQRVAIARAIVTNPKYIFADEPTGNLDSKTTKGIMDLFKALHNTGKTVVIVTHDLFVAGECNRVVTLVDGKIANDVNQNIISN